MKEVKSDQEYRDIVAKDELSVGVFTTTWCPDCKRLKMFIDEIVEENGDKLRFTVDRDQFPEVSEEQNVMGIPSLLVFKNGEKLAHLHSANAKTAEQVRDFLTSIKK